LELTEPVKKARAEVVSLVGDMEKLLTSSRKEVVNG
ncbi:MAG: ParA family protein, partial [Mesorhizobium sp.]